MPIHTPPGLIEGLTATDHTVYAGTGKALSAFDAASGKRLWRNEAWNQREGTTSTLSANADVVIGSVQWGALYANDTRNGKRLWARSDNGLRNRGPQQPSTAICCTSSQEMRSSSWRLKPDAQSYEKMWIIASM